MDHHLEEWRRRGHIVKVMPVERLTSYLRFDPSSDLALVDAIICWAASGVFTFNGAEVAPLYPLGTALHLAHELGSLPESCAMHDGRKWKQLPFIIFAGVGENPPPYYFELLENVTVLPLICNQHPHLAIARIQDCVDSYHDRVISDYRSTGILVRFEKGHIQIGPALTPRDPDAEGAYYLGRADRRDHRGWVTFTRDREGLSQDVETFRCLLERSASETEMHRFFEQHPAILLEATECIPLSHRPSFASPRQTTPDYALSPLLGPVEANNFIGLLELKGPGEKLLTSGLHAGFAAKVHRAVDQVRDYDRYLLDPRNREVIKRSFGYIPKSSRLAVLIGRAPRRESEVERLSQRREEIDVDIVTYDEILQKQVDQMSFRAY